jgi:hypothetical protein
MMMRSDVVVKDLDIYTSSELERGKSDSLSERMTVHEILN